MTVLMTGGAPPPHRSGMSGRSTVGGYFGIDTRISRVKGATGVFVGAEAVLLIDHRFAVGLGGLGLANDDARIDTGTAGSHPLEMGYGGVRLGYVARPASVAHPTVDVLVGAGSVRAEECSGGDESSDRVFVLEPSVGLEVSAAPALRLGVGSSYRYVGGVALEGASASDLRAFSGEVVVRVGKF